MKLACIAAGVVSAVGLTTSAQATIVLDFEGFDNGQSISNGFIFDTIVGGASITASGDNLGAAIFDSTMGGPNADGPDPDLLVGLGNVLILQNNNTPDMTGDLFNTPDDDPNGGSIVFDWGAGEETTGVELSSIDLIDIDRNGQDATVILTDAAGLTRTYVVPSNWTRDIDLNGPLGYGTLDLTTLDDQAGELDTVATASEDIGFSSTSVLTLEVIFEGSAALDNIVIVPAPAATALLFAPLFSRRRRRRA